MYTIGICDDDSEYAKLLEKKLLEMEKSNARVQKFTSGELLLASPALPYFNMIFLDIILPVRDGIEIAGEIRKINKTAVLVLCSGIKEPFPDCFGFNVYKFIVKRDKLKMDQAIRASLEEMHRLNDPLALVITSKGYKFRINIHKIIYIERADRKSIFHLWSWDSPKGNTISAIERLDDVYRTLQDMSEALFGFPHNSYIVN